MRTIRIIALLQVLVISCQVLAERKLEFELYGDKVEYSKSINVKEAREIAIFVKDLSVENLADSEQLRRDILTDLGKIKRGKARNSFEVSVGEYEYGHFILYISRMWCGLPNCTLKYNGISPVKY